jgi:hypothetical protein
MPRTPKARPAPRSSPTSARNLEDFTRGDDIFSPSTGPSTEPWERELTELGGAAAAIHMALASSPIPKRAAAFANLQIEKNLHSVYLMGACARAGCLSCLLPAGLREFPAARVGSSGTTAQCGFAPELCHRQGIRNSMLWEKNVALGDAFVSFGRE